MPDSQGSSPSQSVTRLRLKKREERRVEAGHLWVFSNEIDTSSTPLKNIEPGSPAILESSSGKFLGHAYVNPASLICCRVVSTDKTRAFNATVLRERLRTALEQRTGFYSEPYYRWVHGEGDFLPGLVIDRYGDTVIAQITTAGMEAYRNDIVDAIVKLSDAKHVCLRNDSAMRDLEGLTRYREWVVGDAPDALRIVENGLSFEVPTELGQKTGWFYDHRDSRRNLRAWVKDKQVLDLYCYAGAFGLNAAAAGASDVLAIDASESAVAAANANAALNGLSKTFKAEQADVVEKLRQLFTESAQFDAIVLDPPAFIKRKKDRDAGLRHYALNNRLAMKLLRPGGLLLSASCSQALDLHALQQAVRQGIPKARQGIQILQTFQQAPDHPVNVSMPESLYLKGIIARLV